MAFHGYCFLQLRLGVRCGYVGQGMEEMSELRFSCSHHFISSFLSIANASQKITMLLNFPIVTADGDSFSPSSDRSEAHQQRLFLAKPSSQIARTIAKIISTNKVALKVTLIFPSRTAQSSVDRSNLKYRQRKSISILQDHFLNGGGKNSCETHQVYSKF